MTSALIATVLVLAVLLSAVWARSARRGRRSGRAASADGEYANPPDSVDRTHPLLNELTITRLGYDRRIAHAFRHVRQRREHLQIEYSFASGFGENRRQLRFVIACCGADRSNRGRLIVTTDDHISAAAMRPGWRRVQRGAHWWISNDESELNRSSAALTEWLTAQPTDRTIEFHDASLAVYQPASAAPDLTRSLTDALDKLTSLDGIEKASVLDPQPGNSG